MEIKALAQQIVEFYEKLSSWEHAVVKESGLSPGQMHAIEIIGHAGALRMKELAGKLGVSTGTLTVTVDRLEKLGLLERRPHESDRRSIMVVLTAAGQEHFARHHQLHVQLTEEIAAVLSPEEFEGFADILAKVVRQI